MSEERSERLCSSSASLDWEMEGHRVLGGGGKVAMRQLWAVVDARQLRGVGRHAGSAKWLVAAAVLGQQGHGHERDTGTVSGRNSDGDSTPLQYQHGGREEERRKEEQKGGEGAWAWAWALTVGA